MNLKSILSLFMVVALLIGCASENEIKILRLGHGSDVSHSVHKAMIKMGEDLLEHSGGRLKLEIYPSQ